MVPQWSTPSYFDFIVVELWRTCISASKPITGSGFYCASITTIPRRMSVLTSFSLALLALREKQTSSPAKAYVRATLLTWIDLIVTPLKFLNLSGPKRQALFNVAIPDFMIPDTTKPTPSTWKHSFISNYRGCWEACSADIGFRLSSLEMKSIKSPNPVLLTLETGKIGHTVPADIDSASLICSASNVF